ncbi:MAG: hypothetical protein HYY16_05115 [Planctomycetes bacterium]|nr:hypothetical protein [Planctomycetota bacterium]
MAEEENIEEGAAEEEVQQAEFVPEPTVKPKPDVFTALLAVAFAAFFIGTLLAANELYDFYDVQFWILSK